VAQTVLVTGGTGFIAGWCIVQLLERGYAVRTTVRDAAKEQRVRAAVRGNTDRLSVVVADLNHDRGWDAAVAGCDYVLHVASPLGGGAVKDRHALVAPARDGTLRVLRAAAKAGVKRVVMTSAAATARPPLTSDRVSDDQPNRASTAGVHAGPVSINTADAATLARELKGIGLKRAQSIVDYRVKNGPFKSADELALVKGIGKAAIDRNRTDIRIDGVKAVTKPAVGAAGPVGAPSVRKAGASVH